MKVQINCLAYTGVLHSSDCTGGDYNRSLAIKPTGSTVPIHCQGRSQTLGLQSRTELLNRGREFVKIITEWEKGNGCSLIQYRKFNSLSLDLPSPLLANSNKAQTGI